MYTPVGIEQLSQAQIKKLLLGGRVRVKAGNALQLQMVQEHKKKIASAAKKGSGMMIQLDPYACDLNRESLEGCGVGKKMKVGFQKIGQYVKGNKEAFRPMASALKQAGRDKIAEATMAALDAGVDPSMVAAYSQLAQDIIPSGQGIAKKAAKFFRSPAIKTVRKAFRPLAQQAFEDAQDVAFQSLDQATQQALSGQGIAKKAAKFFRSPAIKTVRKAFRPLAQQAFEDAQDVAFQSLDQATQQALSGQGIAKKAAKFFRSPAIKTVRKAFRPLADQAFADAQDIAFQTLDQATQQALSGQGMNGQSNSEKSGKFAHLNTPKARAYMASKTGSALFPAGYGGSFASFNRKIDKSMQ